MKTVSSPGARHGSRSLPWRSILLIAAAIAAYGFAGPAPGAWVFDRLAIEQGEWWRLITGHWVHSGPEHAAWNIAALGLFAILFETRLRWGLPLVLLASTFAVDAWLWWGDPALRYYCGLSGILNGLLVLGLWAHWRESRHPLVLLTAVGAALKIIVEIQGGQALLTRTAWPSVPEVHAAGFICGLVTAWVLQIRIKASLPRAGSANNPISRYHPYLFSCESRVLPTLSKASTRRACMESPLLSRANRAAVCAAHRFSASFQRSISSTAHSRKSRAAPSRFSSALARVGWKLTESPSPAFRSRPGRRKYIRVSSE